MNRMTVNGFRESGREAARRTARATAKQVCCRRRGKEGEGLLY